MQKSLTEKIINKLQEVAKHEDISPFDDDAMLHMSIGELKAIVRETEVKHDNGWIYCIDQLPSKEEAWIGTDETDAKPRQFLVMAEGGMGGMVSTTGYFIANEWRCEYAGEIVAWQHFPKAPTLLPSNNVAENIITQIDKEIQIRQGYLDGLTGLSDKTREICEAEIRTLKQVKMIAMEESNK